MPRQVREKHEDEELDWDSEKFGSMSEYAQSDDVVEVEQEEEQ